MTTTMPLVSHPQHAPKMKARQIRFAPVVECRVESPTRATPSQSAAGLSPQHRRQTKGRSGCRECKLRHVKCDETFPICLRCQRLGKLCQPLPKLEQWQVEVPWISQASVFSSNGASIQLPCVKKKLLGSWFQTTSRIMVMDPGKNPLSLPLLAYCTSSPSLVHVLQSITAGYQEFFASSRLTVSLEERDKALVALQKELGTRGTPIISHLLTAYLLGVSSTFLDDKVSDYGRAHLLAARNMLGMILPGPESLDRETTGFLVGACVYWDMTCSLLLDPVDGTIPDSTGFPDNVLAFANKQHPITGCYTSLFYTLGNLGRYCRTVLDTGVRDESVECGFQQTLLQWKPSSGHRFWEITAHAFRHHGLIMLHSLGERKAEDGLRIADGVDDVPREYAVRTVRHLLEIPVNSEFLVLQPTPLMTAGAELKREDSELRQAVVGRFKALYSFNRLPVSLHAVQLLEELWEMRDRGTSMSWVELMLAKGWRLRLG